MAGVMGGFGAMFSGNIASSLASVLPILAFVLVIGAGIVALLYYKRYNIEVEIYSPRANNTVTILKDRGGFIKTRGGTEFKLMKQKAYVPSLTIEHIITSGRKNYLKLFELDKGELLPVGITVEKEHITLVPEEGDIKEYRKQRFMKNKIQWENKTPLEAIIPILTIAVPSVLLIVLFYVVLQKYGLMASTLEAMSKNLVGMCSGGAPL